MRRPRLIAILLALLTVAVFAPVTRNGYVHYDDDEYIVYNPQVHQGLTAQSIAWAFTTGRGGNYHPLTWLAHELVWQVWGVNPAGHHAAGVLLHALNAALVFLLLYRLTGATWRAAIVAAAFALHPLRVESVAWAAELKDVLSATFGLLALLAYTGYAREPRWWRMAGVAALLALGLLAKPMLVTLPIVMLLLDWWPLQRGIEGSRDRGIEGKRRQEAAASRANLLGSSPPSIPRSPYPSIPFLLLEKLPLFLLAASSCIVTFIVQRRAGAVAPWEYIRPGTRLAGALIGYTRYLGKTFWPVDLAVFYPRPDAWPAGQAALAAALLLGVTLAAVALRRRVPALLVGWLWFLGMLVPVSGIVQAGMQSIADRYTYLAHVGLLMALVWTLAGRWDATPARADAASRRSAPGADRPGPMGPAGAAMLAAAALLTLALLTRAQIAVWRDAYTLFVHASRVTPNNYMAYTNLGSVLAAETGREAESLEYLRRAAAAGPNVPNTQVNYGLALAKSGRSDEAEPFLRRALSLDPSLFSARITLAMALERSGRPRDAIQEYRAALRAQPSDPVARARLGVCLARVGDVAAALEQFRAGWPGPESRPATGGGRADETAMAALEELVRLHPDNNDYRFVLGLSLLRAGDRDHAARQFRTVLERDPSYGGAQSGLEESLRPARE